MVKQTAKQHYEKYNALAAELGVTLKHLAESTFLGYTVGQLRVAFSQDPYLNNIPLRTWDNMAYAFLATGGRGFQSKATPGRSLSLGEVVCLYKHLVIYDLIGATPDFEK